MRPRTAGRVLAGRGRELLRSVLLALVLLAALATPPAWAQAPAQTASIAGRVVDAELDGGGPLEDVCVRLLDPNGTAGAVPGLLARTDVEGRYVLAGIPAGRYVASFYPCSTTSPSWPHDGQLYAGADDVADAQVLDLAAGEARTDVDAGLRIGTAIGGTVRDASGAPITSGDVCVQMVYGAYTTVRTDAQGRWRMSRLAATRYPFHLLITDCSGSARDDIGTYYDPQGVGGEGAPIDVRYHQDQLDLDQTLQQGARVSGRVTGLGQPLHTGISVYATDADTGKQVGTGVSPAEDGTYLLRAVPVLPQGVRVHVRNYYATQPRWVEQDVGGSFEDRSGTVLHPTPDRPATGADADLQVGGTITGLATDSGGGPATSTCVQPVLAGSSHVFGPVPVPSGSGRWTAGALPPGRWSLRLDDCSPDRPSGLAPRLADVGPLAADQVVDVGTLVLRPAAGLQGTLTQLDGGAPAAGACATAAPADGDPTVPVLRLAADADGRYASDELTAGVQYVVGFDDCPGADRYASRWYDGAAIRARATSVVPSTGPPTTADGVLPAQGPAVRLTRAPADAGLTARSREAVRFVLPADATSATCALDGGPPAPCSSPWVVGPVADGLHALRVRALDAAGRPGPPADVRWGVRERADAVGVAGDLAAGDVLATDEPGDPLTPLTADLALGTPGLATLVRHATSSTYDTPRTATATVDAAAIRPDGTRLPAAGDPPARLRIAIDPIVLSVPGPVVVAVTRDGAAVPACGPTPEGTCVRAAVQRADGGVDVEVRAADLGTFAVALAHRDDEATPPTGTTTLPATTPTTPVGGGVPPATTTTAPAPPEAPAPTTSVPAPTPTSGGASPGPAASAPAAGRPTLALRASSLRTALASGLRAVVRCPAGACTGRATLTLGAADAKALGLRARTVATGAVARAGTLRLRFTARARRALARRRSVRLALRVVVLGPGGARTTLRRSVVLRAPAATATRRVP